MGAAKSTIRYVLRDLPGIAKIEQLLEVASRHPNPLWAKERAEAERLIEPLSRRLFGITEDDTRYSYDPQLERFENGHADSEWEDHFDFLWDDDIDEDAAWKALGWDATDGSGEYLHCLRFFGRQMVAVALGLAGHPPGQPTEMTKQEEKDLETRLRDEALKFRSAGKQQRD